MAFKPRLYAIVEFDCGLSALELYPVLSGLIRSNFSFAQPIIIIANSRSNIKTTYTCGESVRELGLEDYLEIADVKEARAHIAKRIEAKSARNERSEERTCQIGLDLMYGIMYGIINGIIIPR